MLTKVREGFARYLGGAGMFLNGGGFVISEMAQYLAAKRIRQELEDQGPLNGLHFWLDELIGRNSKEFESIASDIVTRAGHGQISFETLFWISDSYLRPQTSIALKLVS